MSLPNVSEADIKSLFDGVDSAVEIGSGGQKRVFEVVRNGERFALKFALLPVALNADAAEKDETFLRAARETQIMRDCHSPHIVKLGPLDLSMATVAGQNVIVFSEELIEGQALNTRLMTQGPSSTAEVIAIATDMTSAIQELWSKGKIHRDIKPANIMRRDSDGSFVLLDAGFAFDVTGESLSGGVMVGTMAYFSPEQFDYTSRRTMDFRSDIFSLGVTLYQMATGYHPFWDAGTSAAQLFSRISKHRPTPPSTHNTNITSGLEQIIMRMIGKAPHLRYRRPEQLLDALHQLGVM